MELLYIAECEITVADNSDNIIMFGQCGDNAYYELDGNDLLTISGLGEMWGYDCKIVEDVYDIYSSSENTHGESPFKLNEKIKRVEINEGITYVGSCTFAYCSNLETIELPDTLVYIGAKVFSGLSSVAID